jgi:hypothetical protein
MMKKRTYMWLGVLLAALFLVSTVLTGCATKSESIAPAPNAAVGPIAASSVATAATGSAPGAPQEGIKVHGHWTIEVKNPDGTLAEQREFENALTSDGPIFLANILGRNRSVGGWVITLFSPGLYNSAWGDQVYARIAESGYPFNNPSDFPNLTLDLQSTKLVLSGTATALSTGTINQVRTLVYVLGPTNPPSSFYTTGPGAYNFTATDVTPPLALTTGQSVTVTVNISFS